MKKIIISREPDFKAKGFEIADSPQMAIEKLSGEGFKKLLISGGATINSLFAKSNLIDEVVLIIEPVIIGEGIPLFRADKFDLSLSYVSSEELEDGRIKIKYRVNK